MKVKIDTKEKMHVITVEEHNLSANMTDDLRTLLLRYLQEDVANVVVNCREVAEMALEAAKALATVQQTFYAENHSMVICGLQRQVADFLDEHELLEVLNTTPTESEAWDMVQMEEIEREFL